MHLTDLGMKTMKDMSHSEIMIVLNIAKWTDRKDGLLRMTQAEFAEESKVALSTFTRYFTRLSNKAIAVCVGHGRLMLNPRMFCVDNLLDKDGCQKKFDAAMVIRNDTVAAKRERKEALIIQEEEETL